MDDKCHTCTRPATVDHQATPDSPVLRVCLKWTQSFGQESRLVKLESSTPIHCQAALTITFSEELTETPLPAAAAFTVNVGAISAG